MKKGFTLIELLLVLAIVAILAGIVISQLSPAREKARDAKRISDIHQIQLALEAYFEKSPLNDKKYPENLDILVTEGLMSVLPTDPTPPRVYTYTPSYTAPKINVGDPATGYCLGATLENPQSARSTADGSDIVITSQNICNTSDLENNYKVKR